MMTVGAGLGCLASLRACCVRDEKRKVAAELTKHGPVEARWCDGEWGGRSGLSWVDRGLWISVLDGYWGIKIEFPR